MADDPCEACGQKKKRNLIPPKVQVAIACAMLTISVVGFFLALLRIFWTHEGYATLLLSWAALAYAGFVALEVA